MASDSTGESFEDFRKRVDAAVLAVMNGDSSAWEAIYSHEADATLFGGWGGPGERGWDQLAARWRMVKSRYRSSTLQVERISEHVTPDMAVTVELARGDAKFSDGSSGPIALRVTHVFRREHGQWRLVHRHADEQMKLLPIEAHIQRP
jgi:ketosteroid isomerase-like protein